MGVGLKDGDGLERCDVCCGVLDGVGWGGGGSALGVTRL